MEIHASNIFAGARVIRYSSVLSSYKCRRNDCTETIHWIKELKGSNNFTNESKKYPFYD